MTQEKGEGEKWRCHRCREREWRGERERNGQTQEKRQRV